MQVTSTRTTKRIGLWFLALSAFSTLLSSAAVAQSLLAQAPLAQSAPANSPPALRLPKPPLNNDAMRDAGWTLRKFDFSNSSVDFSAWLPPYASLQTAPLPATLIEPGSIGRTFIPAEYKVPTPDGDVIGKVITLTTVYPAATEPVCTWLLEEAGYEIVSITRTADLTGTQLAGVKDAGRQGMHATCYARGRITLALAHSYEAEAGASEEKLRNLARATEAVGILVADPIVFANDRDPWLEQAAMKRLHINEGEEQWYVEVPDAWPLALNEFNGKLPGRLMLASDGMTPSRAVGFAIIQLGDAQAVEQNLAAMALRMFKQDFATTKDKDGEQQATDVVIAGSETLGSSPGLAKAGVTNLSVRAALTADNGKQFGDLTAFGAFKDGKLYLLYFYSTVPYAPKRDIMGTRLPGETTFLAFREKLLERLK